MPNIMSALLRGKVNFVFLTAINCCVESCSIFVAFRLIFILISLRKQFRIRNLRVFGIRKLHGWMCETRCHAAVEINTATDTGVGLQHAVKFGPSNFHFITLLLRHFFFPLPTCHSIQWVERDTWNFVVGGLWLASCQHVTLSAHLPPVT